MAIIYVDNVLPETSGVAENLNLGTTGDSVTIPTGATLKTNKIFDAGGNNGITSDGSGNLTVNSGMTGDVVPLQTQTISSAVANITFSDTYITSTYLIYCFKWVNVRPVTDNTSLQFQMSTDGTNYNLSITAGVHASWIDDSGGNLSLGYSQGSRQGAGTSFQNLCYNLGNDTEAHCSGELWLIRGASTAFQHHFWSTAAWRTEDNYAFNGGMHGAQDPPVAINHLRFQQSSGNLAAGKFTVYGWK